MSCMSVMYYFKNQFGAARLAERRLENQKTIAIWTIFRRTEFQPSLEIKITDPISKFRPSGAPKMVLKISYELARMNCLNHRRGEEV